MQVPTMLGGAPLSETLRARTLKIQESITAGGGARQDNISRETLPSRKFEHWRDDRFFFLREFGAIRQARVWARTLLHLFSALVNLSDKNGLPATSALKVSDLALAGSRCYPSRLGPSLSALGQILAKGNTSASLSSGVILASFDILSISALPPRRR